MKKNRYMVLLSLSLLFLLANGLPSVRAQTTTFTYTDPADDVYCISILDLLELMSEVEDIDELDSFEDIYLLLGQMASKSTRSDGPDCIDIIRVVIEKGALISRITIEMEGPLDACENEINILVYGNCSSDAAFFSTFTYSSTGGDGGGPSYDAGYMSEEGWVSANSSVDGASISWDFPTALFDYEEECFLFIIATTITGSSSNPLAMTLCYDIFPNSVYDMANRPGAYTGPDSIVSFIDSFAHWLFWFLCGRLPFIMLIIIFVACADFLIDRGNKGYKGSKTMKYMGVALMLFCIYVLISYTLFIDLYSSLSLRTIFDIMDVISLVALLFFAIVSLFAGFKKPLMKDNDWLLILSASIALFSGVLFVLPFFYPLCGGGSPIIGLIVQILLMVLCLISVRVSKLLKNKGR